MNNLNEELLLNDLAAFDWKRIPICSPDINEVVQNWTNILYFVVGKHAPLVERRVSDKLIPYIIDVKRKPQLQVTNGNIYLCLTQQKRTRGHCVSAMRDTYNNIVFSIKKAVHKLR